MLSHNITVPAMPPRSARDHAAALTMHHHLWLICNIPPSLGSPDGSPVLCAMHPGMYTGHFWGAK